jgi:hypothetical protein
MFHSRSCRFRADSLRGGRTECVSLVAVVGGHIYWTNDGFVGRANLDGTGVNRRFIRTASGPCGVAAYQGHIYWTQWKGGIAHPSTTIGRANLDGSSINNQFVTGIHAFCGGLAIG